MDKCIVKGCSNHEGEGKFVSGLCAPCYTMLAQGKKTPSEAWFAKPWVGLTDDEFKTIMLDTYNIDLNVPGHSSDDHLLWANIESKLKEKNGG